MPDTIQASYTPEGGSAIKMVTFSYTGDFELEKTYRESKQPGASGAYVLELDTLPKKFSSECVMAYANFAAFKAQENTTGTLVVRGESVTVRFLSISKIRDIVTGATLVDDMITTTSNRTHTICTLTFVIEVIADE